MPGMDAAQTFAELRAHEAALPKMLYAVDARTGPDSPVTELAGLQRLATAAVGAGGGHVLGASHAVFPNGAITLVLILAESHLSIHTWPEEDLIAIDLFCCGAMDATRTIGELVSLLGLEGVSVSRVPRGRPAGHG
jgi:S-adenosylmethionine decarboxylase